MIFPLLNEWDCSTLRNNKINGVQFQSWNKILKKKCLEEKIYILSNFYLWSSLKKNSIKKNKRLLPQREVRKANWEIIT